VEVPQAISDHPPAVKASLDQSAVASGDTNLEVSSTPAGADIEVNGEFVGNAVGHSSSTR
jgi:hypothetical protein